MTARHPARSGSDTARRDRVRALLAPVVSATGLELEDVELRTVGRRLVLRVLVDSATGVSLDEVATASTAVSDALDSSTVLGDEPYTLEVSSPGVDRPLTLPRHWQRNIGRLVAVTLADGTTITGRLVAVAPTEDTVELETSVKGRTSRRTVALADVRRAVVEVEFNRSASGDADAGDAADDTADDTAVNDDTDGTDGTDDIDDIDDTDDIDDEDGEG